MNRINKNIHHLNDRVQWEFKCIESYLHGKGIDVGCGTNRLSPDILALDRQPNKAYSHADIVHDCKDLEYGKPFEWKGEAYHFDDNEFDFIFSSHVLEDFPNIPEVFMNWWKKLKPNGYMLLLLPDMEPCKCDLCSRKEQVEYRKNQGLSARYWTIEDHKKNGKGNPAHQTDVGMNFMLKMLKELPIEYKMIQADTLPHDKTCSIDFVIKKK